MARDPDRQAVVVGISRRRSVGQGRKPRVGGASRDRAAVAQGQCHWSTTSAGLHQCLRAYLFPSVGHRRPIGAPLSGTKPAKGSAPSAPPVKLCSTVSSPLAFSLNTTPHPKGHAVEPPFAVVP